MGPAGTPPEPPLGMAAGFESPKWSTSAGVGPFTSGGGLSESSLQAEMELISHGRSQARVPAADLDPVLPGGEVGDENLAVLNGTARDRIAGVVGQAELDPGGQVSPCEREAVGLATGGPGTGTRRRLRRERLTGSPPGFRVKVMPACNSWGKRTPRSSGLGGLAGRVISYPLEESPESPGSAVLTWNLITRSPPGPLPTRGFPARSVNPPGPDT